MAKSGRSVDFSVRAKDEFSKVLNDLEKQQNKLSASAKAANRRSLLGVSKGEVQSAADEYKRLTADVERYRQVQSNAAKTGKLSASEMRELGDSIALVRGRSREAMQALQQKRAALNQIVGSSVSGFTAFNRLASVMERSSTAASQESAAVTSTAAQLNKLNTSSNNAARAQNKLKTQLNSTTAAIQKQRLGGGGRSGAKGDAQDVEIYGLKPWQMTNLGYQINDVVSGLAMGQRPMQVFAQQAGQIAQIWPTVMVTLVRSIPQILALSAAFAPFIAAALRMKEAGDTLKYFKQQLAFSASGGEFNAEQLTKMALAFKDIGISASDARTMISGFMKQGIKSSQFTELATMAKDLAAFTGNSVAEEAERLTKAFGTTFDQVVRLDEELNFLTADQLRSMNAMREAGNATGAMALAQEALAAKLKATRNEGDSWTAAMKSMGDAWDALVDLANRSGLVQFLAREVEKFGRDVSNAANDIKKFASALNSLVGVKTIEDLDAEIKDLQDTLEDLSIDIGFGLDENAIQKTQEKLDETIALKESLIELSEEEVDVIDDINEGLNQRLKAEDSIQGVINKAIKAMAEESRLASLTNKERFVEEKLLEARNKALEEANRLGREFLGLNVEQTKEIMKQADVLYNNQQYDKITGNSANAVDKIVGVESGGDRFAKNGLSSATGLGQFIETTWLGLFRKHFPDTAANMTEPAILALRTNADVSRQMVELYIRDNAKILRDAGVAIDDAALYLSHFLGPSGAVAVLTAQANTPVSELLKANQINANKSILQGKTAGDVRNWSQQKMGVSDPEIQVQKTLLELDQKRLETEKEYAADYTKRVEQQQFELGLISKSAREAAILKAVRSEELKALEAGKTLTQEQRIETEKLAAAQFDNANANLEVNQLMEQRKLLLESLEIAKDAGDTGKVEATVEQISAIETQLQAAIEKAIQFWQAIGGPGADAAILSLQNMSAGIGKAVNDLKTKFLPTAQQLNEQMADIGGNAFSAFAQAIANGENAAKAFFDTLLQGIANFLIEIGKAIVKQALFNAISGGTGSGGIGGAIFGGLGKLFGANHTGGLIGQSPMARMVDPSIFKYAAKHHSGGVIGRLGSNEVPIVGLRDEEVLTTDDPRHRYNGGGGGQAINLKNVNVFDPRDILENALATVEGERVMMNWLTRNSSKVSGAISG